MSHEENPLVRIWAQLIHLSARIESLAKVVLDNEHLSDPNAKERAYLQGIADQYERALLEIGDYNPQFSEAIAAQIKESRQRILDALDEK